MVIFDLTFLPGGREFDSNLLGNVKIPLYAPLLGALSVANEFDMS